ncbi:unnamed protein product [Sympodiomycopsis kandeliae]
MALRREELCRRVNDNCQCFHSDRLSKRTNSPTVSVSTSTKAKGLSRDPDHPAAAQLQRRRAYSSPKFKSWSDLASPKENLLVRSRALQTAAMSRLIVKNLPAYLSDVRLKEHFSQKGLVTDVKLMTRPDGTSRRFGFVGYRDEEQAQQALDYFNRTYIDTSRIQVELAKKIGDDELAAKREARMGKQQSEQHAQVIAGSSTSNTSTGPASSTSAHKKRKDAKEKAASAKGVSFEEFMAVMAPSKKRKTWQNEEDDPELKLKSGEADQASKEAKQERKKQKQKARAEAEAEAEQNQQAEPQKSALPIGPAALSEREATPDDALNDDGLTDMEYMARRMRRGVGKEEIIDKPEAKVKEFDQSDSEAGSDAEEDDSDDDDDRDEAQKTYDSERIERERLALEEKSRKDQEVVDTIMSSARLFVRNLPFAITEEALADHFAQFGPIKQSHIPLDKSTKASKGLAFVTFEDASHALSAYRAADGSFFQGRLLHLLPAVDLRPPSDAPKTLKQSKADDRKARADKDFNWSMLYMSADAVASSVSDRLGVSKAEILNPSDADGDSAAVRLALAETRVIKETKEFLEKEGVNVEAFSSGTSKKNSRSDTTILVKNIPYGTTMETIRELFEKHGEVDRVLIPPSGTLALVEMTVPGEARLAFKALAYKRLGNSILYLEKVPSGLVKPSASRAEDASGHGSNKTTVAAPPSKHEVLLGAGAGSEADAEAGATLFVKNLSFSTTDTKLADFFGTLPEFAFARVQTRTDGRDPTKRLSMGYGFVGYRSVSSAQTAMTTLNGKDLDGHSLSLSFARRGQDGDDSGSKKQQKTSTKLIVKNLPFEATKKDVRALFSSHGQLKSVRVPRKAASLAGASGGGARGFAFVEFTTKKEAESAFEALKHTHLLGRHLVLVWDHEDSQGVEGIREKVKASFQGAVDANSRRKKEKLKLGEEDIAEASRKEREARDDVDE